MYAIVPTPAGVLHLRECSAVPDHALCWCEEGDTEWTYPPGKAPRQKPQQADSEANQGKVKSYRGKKKTPQATPGKPTSQNKAKRSPDIGKGVSQCPEVTLLMVSGKSWKVTPKDWARWQKVYDWDILPEMRKAELWLKVNKHRRKASIRGLRTFVTNWLNGADERRNRPSGGQHAAGKPDIEVQFNLLWGRLVKKFPAARDWPADRIREAFEKAGHWRPEFTPFLEK